MRHSAPEDWPKLVVCALGVDVEEFKTELRRELGKPLRLLCIGRLCSAKGQHLLLSAMDDLRARGLDCVLDLVGDGPDRHNLEATVLALNLQTLVTLHGAVGVSHVQEFMRQADLFVLPSFAEGVPVVLMEAMAMGLPCISTTITGIPELITPDEDGVLVPPGDAHTLAEQIYRLCSDQTLRKKVITQARQKVLDCYNLQHNSEKLSNWLTQ